jgi:hypothetical protein
MHSWNENIPLELQPYFEVCFILGFGICSSCRSVVQFQSQHPRFSDGYWLDEAKAMMAAKWTVPEPQRALCSQCSKGVVSRT